MNGRVIVALAVLALVAGTAGLVVAQYHGGRPGGYALANADGAASCAAHQGATAAGNASCDAHGGATASNQKSCDAHQGALTGAFDVSMCDACEHSCAAKDVKTADIVPQPGAIAGRPTRCPVSGAVFTADAEHPHVAYAGHEYVLCCEGCAKKFRKDPGRFVIS